MSAGEILDNLSHLPDGIDHPAVVGIAAAATAAAISGTYLHHRFAEAKRAEVFGGNHELAEQAVVNVRGGRETVASKSRRLAPVLGVIAGAGLAAAAYFGHPTYDTSHSDTGANNMIVIDGSNSMIYTKMDSANTRYAAAIDGLSTDSAYQGRLGVIVTGADSATSIPLGSDWHKSLRVLEEPGVDPNGGQLASAITDAVQQLPLIVTKDGQQKRNGQVVVVSDGSSSINSTNAGNIEQAINNVRQSGASVRVVVPGTADGSYKLDGQTYASAAEPQLFGASDVIEAASASDVASDIRRAVASTSTIHEQKPWELPLDLGIVIGLGSVAWLGERTIRRN